MWCSDVLYCRIEKKLEMFDTDGASIDLIKSRDIEIVTHIRFERVSKVLSIQKFDFDDLVLQLYNIVYQTKSKKV